MLRRNFSICSIVLGLLVLLVLALGTGTQAQAAPMAAGGTATVTPTPTSRPGSEFVGTPLSGTAPLAVTFTHTNPSVLSQCTWTFGDGTSQSFTPSPGTTFAACPSVSHTYTAAGSYSVTLSVIKATNGFSGSTTKADYIQVTGSVTPTPTNSLLPDLTITSIAYVGSSPACANQPRDNVVVSNIGSGNAGAFVVAFGAQTQSVSGLGAGQKVTLSFSALSVGTATADSTNVVAESNETNNSLSAQLPVPTQAFTCTPTSGPSLTPTRTPTLTNTPTAAPFVSGHVRVGSSSGPALANVQVCYYLAAYSFDCANHTTLTDQNGYYQLSICVPQQEDVTIQASLSGYTFSPAAYYSILYSGCKTGTFDFVAQPSNINTVTPTPTPTRTPTITPTSSAACSPVTATITAPFTKDGAGTFCWQSSNLGSYINSWNLANLTVNGVNFTNAYVSAANLPAKINGFWYISYTGNFAWSHFETK